MERRKHVYGEQSATRLAAHSCFIFNFILVHEIYEESSSIVIECYFFEVLAFLHHILPPFGVWSAIKEFKKLHCPFMDLTIAKNGAASGDEAVYVDVVFLKLLLCTRRKSYSDRLSS